MSDRHITKYMCPVCGYKNLDEPPYSGKGSRGSASYEICPSCRFQFGYTDDATHITHEQWREKWVAEGMIWDKGQSPPPPDWNPHEQLLNIGVKV